MKSILCIKFILFLIYLIKITASPLEWTNARAFSSNELVHPDNKEPKIFDLIMDVLALFDVSHGSKVNRRGHFWEQITEYETKNKSLSKITEKTFFQKFFDFLFGGSEN